MLHRLLFALLLTASFGCEPAALFRDGVNVPAYVDGGFSDDGGVDGGSDGGFDSGYDASEPDASEPDASEPDASACVPECSGLSCGDDGCGGSCGTCGTGTECSGGTCVSTGPAALACDGSIANPTFTGPSGPVSAHDAICLEGFTVALHFGFDCPVCREHARDLAEWLNSQDTPGLHIVVVMYASGTIPPADDPDRFLFTYELEDHPNITVLREDSGYPGNFLQFGLAGTRAQLMLCNGELAHRGGATVSTLQAQYAACVGS